MAELGDVSAGYQASGIRRRRCQLWQYEELTELETSYNSPATELGDVVLVPVADALDETLHAQAFEVSGARDLGHLPPDAHGRLAEDIGEVRRMLYRFI